MQDKTSSGDTTDPNRRTEGDASDPVVPADTTAQAAAPTVASAAEDIALTTPVFTPTVITPTSSSERYVAPPTSTSTSASDAPAPSAVVEPTSSLASPVPAPSVSAPITMTDPTPALSMAPTSTDTPAPVIASMEPAVSFAGSGTPFAAPKPGRRKKLVLGLTAGLLVLLGSAGFVLGYYIPNRPENVWRTAMDRTGAELDGFTDKLADPKTFEAFRQSKLTISGKWDGVESKYAMDMSTAYDESATDTTASFSAKGTTAVDNMDIKVLAKTQLVKDSAWPNVYLNVAGLASLGVDRWLPGINDYDGKWIAVEQDYYQETLGDLKGEEQRENVTRQDVISVIRDVQTVTDEYVFTTDPAKAVVIMKEFVDAETSEGVSVNRYRATIDQKHASAYCKAVVNKVYANEAYKKMYRVDKADGDKTKDRALESCEPPNKDDDEYQQYKETFDVWIDKKYKLFHKVRLTEDLEGKSARYEKQKAECEEDYRDSKYSKNVDDYCDYYDDMITTGSSYVEFGQVYTGADTLKLFSFYSRDTNQDKDALRMDLTVALEGLKTDGKLTYKNDSEDEKGTAEFKISSAPYEGKIDASKPDGSVPIQTVIDRIMQASRSGGRELGATTEQPLRAVNPSDRVLDTAKALFLPE